MARTVVVIPALLGIGIGLGLLSCEAPRTATESSAGGLTYGGGEEPGPGSGEWPDAGAPDAGPGSGGWPDSGTPDAEWPDAEWPDAGTPDAEWPDAGTPTDAPVSDAPTGGDDQPPKDKDGKPIPGWKKKIPLPTPADGQWWKDTDGIDPAVAGCHYAYKTEAKCTANEEIVGWLGEECRENILVETNPEKDKCHEHKDATGHPDTFDCDLYCKGKDKASGKCVKVEKVCDGKDGAKTLPSARCECE